MTFSRSLSLSLTKFAGKRFIEPNNDKTSNFYINFITKPFREFRVNNLFRIDFEVRALHLTFKMYRKLVVERLLYPP